MTFPKTDWVDGEDWNAAEANDLEQRAADAITAVAYSSSLNSSYTLGADTHLHGTFTTVPKTPGWVDGTDWNADAVNTLEQRVAQAIIAATGVNDLVYLPKSPPWSDNDNWDAAAANDLENRMATSIIRAGQLAGVVVPLGDISGVVTCDLALGTHFTGRMVGNCTFYFTNWPDAPAVSEPTLLLIQGGTGGYTIEITGVIWNPPKFDTSRGALNVVSLFSADQGVHLYGITTADAAFSATIPMGLPSPDAPAGSGTWGVTGTPPYLTNTTAGASDSIGWDFALAAGTWNLDLLYATDPTFGTLNGTIDGTSIGNGVPQSAATSSNNFITVPGIVIPTSGNHRLALTPSASFPATSILDNFAVDQNPLGGTWAGPIGTSGSQMKSSGGQAMATSGFSTSYWNVSYALPIETYLTVGTLPGSANLLELGWFTAGIGTASQSGYQWLVWGNGQWWVYAKPSTMPIALGNMPLTAGDKLAMTISAASVIRLWRLPNGASKWTIVATFTDTQFTGSGKLWFATDDTAARFDDFGGGTTTGAVYKINAQGLGFRKVS